MHDAEGVAVRRAVAVLLAVSVLRWGWSHRPAHGGQGESVLPSLLAETREATVDGERRAAPLGQGERVDVNRADEVELDRLPGIGPVTARAIVAARDGGAVFRTPEDLLAVRGVGPATLARMRPSIHMPRPPPRPPRAGPTSPATRVDVNRAAAAELESLPGIGPAIAGRIVDERRERMFTSLDDLQRVRGIGAATIERLRPLAGVGRTR